MSTRTMFKLFGEDFRRSVVYGHFLRNFCRGIWAKYDPGYFRFVFNALEEG